MSSSCPMGNCIREAWLPLLVSPTPSAGVCCAPCVASLVTLPPAMVLELDLDLLSQACHAVCIFAKKNGIPFELHTMELLKGGPSLVWGTERSGRKGEAKHCLGDPSLRHPFPGTITEKREPPGRSDIRVIPQTLFGPLD